MILRQFPSACALSGFRKWWLCACVLLSGVGHAQELDPNDYVLYLDTLEQLASEENHEYVRVLKDFYDNQPSCVVLDFYKSGQRKLVGRLSDKYRMFKSGPFQTYYENGKLESQVSYENDQPVGKCYFWYENGSKKMLGEFLKPKKGEEPIMKIEQYWSRIAIQRVVDGKGHIHEEDLTSFSEGELLNGLKHGLWWGEDYKDYFTFTENYRKGKLVSGVSVDSLGQKHPYTKIYVPPTPSVSIEAFYHHFDTKMKLHQKGDRALFYTMVGVSVVIDRLGKPKNITVLHNMSGALKRQIISFIAGYGNWQPAISRGIKTEESIVIPIQVQLQ